MLSPLNVSDSSPHLRSWLFGLSIFLFSTLLSGCCNCDKLLTSASSFHASVGAQYVLYVNADKTLSPEDKYRKKLNIKLHGKALKRFSE